MPEIYDRCLRAALFEPYARHVGDRVAALAPARVLEIAAGTGIVTAELVRALPHAEITATDLNPAMIEWGSSRAPGANWQQADAQQLPFEDGSFDLVVCQFGVMFFPDRVAAYAEAERVLAPGGAILYLSWDALELNTLGAALVASTDAMFPADPPRFLRHVPHGYHDPDVLRSDVESAGFIDVSVERVALRGATEPARIAAEGLAYGGPMRFELEARGDLDELAARLSDEVAAQLGEDPISGELSALVITARKSG
jgi:ubiquinone/menaquinone biosynthesis C-methylase UbiE